LNPERDVAIVLDSGEDSVSLVDMSTFKELSRFYVGKEPHHLMATPDDRYLIVANAVSNELVFLNPHTGKIERRLKNISDPYQIAFSPDKKWFVTASLRLHHVDIYRTDTFEPVKRIPLEKAPSHLAFDHASSMVFVTLQDTDKLAAIRLSDQTVQWTIPTGSTPAGVRMTSDDRYLLVGVMGKDYVQVIDWRARKTVKNIVTGSGAHNFLASGDGRHVFVSNRVAGTVCIVDELNLTRGDCFSVPGGPDCMELSKDGSQLWITSRWIKTVEVVDLKTEKITHKIAVGRSPHGVYFFPHAPRA
jgi:DNA-binding beta-propeller fold protein YncE